MEEIITTSIIGLITTIAGYFYGSRKSQAETDKIVLDNVKIVLDVYAKTIDDLKGEITILKEKIVEYEKLVENMSEEMELLRSQIKTSRR